jgi:hypothetical protein
MATSILPARKERGSDRVRMCNRLAVQEVLVPAKTIETTWYTARSREGLNTIVLERAM